jgi:pyridoxamine 5'-phosphate oxidase
VGEPTRHPHPPLHADQLAADPIDQFRRWFEVALAEVPLADAMTLATTDADGTPDARMVLLKGYGPDGFRFFSNYQSTKAAQLSANPRAALVVYWRELDRQVRARGPVERLHAADSDAYFASRTRESQLGAWASPQSRTLPDRDTLDRRLREAEARFGGEAEVPRPDFWGGYRLSPEEIEFWQGQEARLHDRFRYTREGSGWRIERLAP